MRTSLKKIECNKIKNKLNNNTITEWHSKARLKEILQMSDLSVSVSFLFLNMCQRNFHWTIAYVFATKSGVLRTWYASSNLGCITQTHSRLLSTVLYITDKNQIKMKKTDTHTSATKTQQKTADHWGLGWRCREWLSVFPRVWSRSGTALAAFGWVLLEWQSRGWGGWRWKGLKMLQ